MNACTCDEYVLVVIEFDADQRADPFVHIAYVPNTSEYQENLSIIREWSMKYIPNHITHITFRGFRTQLMNIQFTDNKEIHDEYMFFDLIDRLFRMPKPLNKCIRIVEEIGIDRVPLD